MALHQTLDRSQPRSSPAGSAPGEPHPFDAAAALFQGGRLYEAEACIRPALERLPHDPRLLNLLGVVLKNLRRFPEALDTFDRAHTANPRSPAPLSNTVNLHLATAEGPRALAAAERLVRLHPKVGEHHRLLGAAARMVGDLPRARRHADQATQLAPNQPQPWIDGAALREAESPDAAIAHLDAGLAAGAEPRPIVLARVATQRRAGRAAEAAVWLEARAGGAPPEAWLELERARCIAPSDRPRANVHLREALRLEPRNADVLMELADSLDRTRGPEEGANIEEAYHLALARIALGRVRQKDLQVLRNILHRSGDFAAAARLGSFEALGRYWSDSGQISALHYHLAQADTPAHKRLLVEWHRRWGRRADAAATPLATPLAAPQVRSGPARLRIGLMSSDLRHHPVSYFALPLIEQFDRERFELFCYSWNSGKADRVQQHIASRATQFRLAPGINDRDAAQMIANDGLDMLFELGGTTHMNKLRVMSYRPAPLQASWLGYPHSAGPERIDYILVDPHIRPADPALLIERPFELPQSWVAMGTLGFDARQAIDPTIPEAREGRITFGTMNNPYKYNPACLAAWAEAVRQVSGSRFLFVRPEGATEPFRANMRRAFEAHGVAPDRVEFVAVRGTHMPHYNAIDIALDTFPQTGGTTTCEALWMGVPTVTLVGEAFFERLSYSNLMNAGLPGLCCFSTARFVQTAVELAADRPRRERWRRGMRQQIRQSPLGRTDWWVSAFQDAVVRAVDGTTA